MKLISLAYLSQVLNAADVNDETNNQNHISTPRFTETQQNEPFNAKEFHALFAVALYQDNFEEWLKSIVNTGHAQDKIFWLQTIPQTLPFKGKQALNNLFLISKIYPHSISNADQARY